MKVAMIPSPEQVAKGESGINTVVRKYIQHLPKFGVSIVAPDSGESVDLFAIHAGMSQADPTAGVPVYAHLHGLYWTADYPYQRWQHAANANILQNLRFASRVSVPSRWVARPFERDMRFTPDVIPHGVDWDEWQHGEDNYGYVLWAKNRVADVCDPSPVGWLARTHRDISFVSTFAPQNAPPNIRTTGVMAHATFRQTMQRAAVYLSTTEETFGVATLEALASGTPVLGYAHGGNLDLIEHGVTGYLARPFDLDDLAKGLTYCLQHRDVLSANAREAAKAWSWVSAAQIVVAAYEQALTSAPPSLSVIIPVYNKTEAQLRNALESVKRQTLPPDEVIVVDDGSDDGSLIERLAKEFGATHIRKENGGVATARNRGAFESSGKYLCFLDADDALAPDFLKTCVNALERDNSLHLAYTGLMSKTARGEKLSEWPGEWDFDQQLKRRNQVPTCNVMRAETFRRLGGYRQRYAPTGAGAEDAELWLRMGAYGYRAARVTAEGLFIYSLGGGHTSQNYNEVDWSALHPWTKDFQHPFASFAKPTNSIAHNVSRYVPKIAVIIPVGAKHGERLLDALDSVESQTERHWEAIVIEDTTADKPFVPDYIKTAFPHVKWLFSDGRGPGAARNLGADAAEADFLLFLDADDNLKPTALEKMLRAWTDTQNIVYTDYLGIVDTDTPEPLIAQVQADPFRRVVAVSDKPKQVIIYHESSHEYDCAKAQRQPDPDPYPYLWCLVTTLIPKAWHIEVGGFDESMASWEDADYHWRLARLGKCYVRVPEALVVYRFATGERREFGGQNAQALLQYLRQKYEGEPTMACGCKGSSVSQSVSMARTVNQVQTGAPAELVTSDGKKLLVTDNDLVRIRYALEKQGKHQVYGAVTRINYGRRQGGDEFNVHKDDVYIPKPNGEVALSNVFVPVGTAAAPPVVRETPKPVLRVALAPPPAPVESVPATALADVDGIDDKTLEILVELGISNAEDLVVAGEAVLAKAGVANPEEVYLNAVLATSG